MSLAIAIRLTCTVALALAFAMVRSDHPTKSAPPRLLTHGQHQAQHLRISSPGIGPIYFVPGPIQAPDLD